MTIARGEISSVREQVAASNARSAELDGIAKKTQAEAEGLRSLASESADRSDKLQAQLSTLEQQNRSLQAEITERESQPTEPPAVTVEATLVDPGVTAEHEQLLVKARAAVKAIRLTTPPGNNAVEYYRKALALIPNSPQALDGLDAVVERYMVLAAKAAKRGSKQGCRKGLAYVQKGLVWHRRRQHLQASVDT